MMVDIIVFFIFLAFVTTLRTCEKVDDTMDSKDNNEEKTREVAIWLIFGCITSVGIFFIFDTICCGHDG